MLVVEWDGERIVLSRVRVCVRSCQVSVVGVKNVYGLRRERLEQCWGDRRCKLRLRRSCGKVDVSESCERGCQGFVQNFREGLFRILKGVFFWCWEVGVDFSGSEVNGRFFKYLVVQVNDLGVIFEFFCLSFIFSILGSRVVLCIGGLW